MILFQFFLFSIIMEAWRKLLKSKNIILFDHDYRISLYRYNQVLEQYNKLMVGGGGKSKKKSKNLFNKLDNNISRIFVDGLIDMNVNKVNWIIMDYVV
jgi:hypothetical protein